MAFGSLIWLAIAVWTLYLMFRRRPEQRRANEWDGVEEQVPTPAKPEWGTEETIVDTVICPSCGAFVAENAAIGRMLEGTARGFCSNECAQSFEGRRQKVV